MLFAFAFFLRDVGDNFSALPGQMLICFFKFDYFRNKIVRRIPFYFMFFGNVTFLNYFGIK